MSDISAKNTHDLWVESRQFTLDISRPSPTTIELTITRPINLQIVDGFVLTLHEKPILGVNQPVDGQRYIASSDFAVPADKITGSTGAQVVAFYSAILGAPMPAGTVNQSAGTVSFSIVVTNTIATQLYYASIHPLSNILQYYPIGVQSYPLESSRIEKDSGSYTGNIPSLFEAPTAPTLGTVYHDKQLNIVQYWDGTSWIPTRADAILTGTANPGMPGQAYFLGAPSGVTLKIFDGKNWISGDSSNFQVRITSPAPGFAPLGAVSTVVKLPDTPAVGDFVWDHTTMRAQYWDGISWIFPNAQNTLFNTGLALIPACIVPLTVEPIALATPVIGQLFYNLTKKALYAWTGADWVQANTDQPGSTSTDKISIGTDGSYDERVRLIKVIKGQLGWPSSCVELAEEQFNIAIDNALDNYRLWGDGAYNTRYIMFQALPEQQTYYLNSPTDGTDHVVDVVKIHRLNILGLQAISGNDAIWSSGILTSYYSAVSVDILSMHLMSAMSEEFQRLFAGDLTFVWNEPSRELFVTRRIAKPEKVILECIMERPEQELLVDRWSKQFIQNWALAECKYQLGMIRSKFTSGTPGAAGPINLNGELLISEANQEMVALKQSMLDYEYGGLIGKGNCSFLFAG